jgi:polyisoprenoid-binding protein YceI
MIQHKESIMNVMKRTLFVALLAVAVPAAAADTWELDPAHSEINFKIRHLISKVSGEFKSFDAVVTTDLDNLNASSVRLTIDAASIDTNNADRDKHLRSPDFFDVEKHPEITFVSSKITRSGDSSYEVTGTFTMHGVSKEIVVPVTFLGSATDPWGNTKAGFEIETTLDRKDYGIIWNKALDAGGYILGDEVEIDINLQVKLAK